jgi:hypothetical protein
LEQFGNNVYRQRPQSASGRFAPERPCSGRHRPSSAASSRALPPSSLAEQQILQVYPMGQPFVPQLVWDMEDIQDTRNILVIKKCTIHKEQPRSRSPSPVRSRSASPVRDPRDAGSPPRCSPMILDEGRE